MLNWCPKFPNDNFQILRFIRTVRKDRKVKKYQTEFDNIILSTFYNTVYSLFIHKIQRYNFNKLCYKWKVLTGFKTKGKSTIGKKWRLLTIFNFMFQNCSVFVHSSGYVNQNFSKNNFTLNCKVFFFIILYYRNSH